MRPDHNRPAMAEIFQRLVDVGEEAPTIEQKVNLTKFARSLSDEAPRQIDEFLLCELAKLKKGLLATGEKQKKLAELLEKMTAPPLFLGTFLGMADASERPSAIVAHSGARRMVVIGPECDASSLAVGDDVLLNGELNVLLGRSPYRASAFGETATYDRACADGRMVLRWNDQEVVVEPSDELKGEEIRSGEVVRWDRSLWMAFEKIGAPSGEHLFLEETPSETFAMVGGLDHQTAQLQRSIRLHREFPEIVRRYGLRRNGSVLLVGPPGTGKTLLARALANWLAGQSRSGRARFMNIKPGSLHSVWYSQSEANYREAFRVAGEAGESEPDVPVVLFFDEVDSIGSTRGHGLHAVDDRVLTAFMTELDGLESRGNVLVVAATNRRESLDPALLRPGRLGDLVIEVPRPDRRAAHQIFAVHLRPDVPYAGSRDDLIAAAVSRIYAPNAATSLATLTFRDGRERVVRASELMSGAVAANVTRRALEAASLREAETGEPGVRLQDLLGAVEDEFTAAAAALTPRNCGSHLEGLPQDVDVVRVEPVQRRAKRMHAYLDVA